MRKKESAISALETKLNPADRAALKQMERIIQMSYSAGMEVVVFKPLSMSKTPLTASQMNTVQQLICVQEAVIRKTHDAMPLDQARIEIQNKLDALNNIKTRSTRLEFIEQHLKHHKHYFAIQAQTQNEGDADLFVSKFYVLSQAQEVALLEIINKSKTPLTPVVEIVDQKDIAKTSPESNINTFTHVDRKLIKLVEHQLESQPAEKDIMLVKFDRLAVKKILNEHVSDAEKNRWSFFKNECETLNLLVSKLHQRAPHSVTERYSDLFTDLNTTLEPTARKQYIESKLSSEKFLMRAKLINTSELSDSRTLFFLMSQEQVIFMLKLLATAEKALSKSTFQSGLPVNTKTKFPKMTKSASLSDCEFCYPILDKMSRVIPTMSLVHTKPELESTCGWRLWATDKTDHFIATLNLQLSNNLGSANLTSTITECLNKHDILAKRMRDGNTHNSVATVVLTKTQLLDLDVDALVSDLDASIKSVAAASNVALTH